MRKLKDFFLLTFSTILMIAGVYFFKFPNNFTFGGVTGIAVLFARLLPFSASDISFIMNMVLLVIGFAFFGKKFGVKTAYTSVLLSVGISMLGYFFPMDSPLTDQPILELSFAITLPAIGSAILFNMGASSGGTDIIAMLLRKYTRVNIGRALLITDMIAGVAACFIFDIKTGLFSFLGLTIKAFMVDGFIERFNLCKYFTVICESPEPICDYIVNTLKRSATTYAAKGVYTKKDKDIILTVLSPIEAVKLRTYIKEVDPFAFIFISNTSEIIGKGFHSI
jgi:uncharacterized membrane-anchored protein YitT (DUF2179 family)